MTLNDLKWKINMLIAEGHGNEKVRLQTQQMEYDVDAFDIIWADEFQCNLILREASLD